ncbi:hypothetical protein D3C73_1285010 [compost metagenome]
MRYKAGTEPEIGTGSLWRDIVSYAPATIVSDTAGGAERSSTFQKCRRCGSEVRQRSEPAHSPKLRLALLCKDKSSSFIAGNIAGKSPSILGKYMRFRKIAGNHTIIFGS